MTSPHTQFFRPGKEGLETKHTTNHFIGKTNNFDLITYQHSNYIHTGAGSSSSCKTLLFAQWQMRTRVSVAYTNMYTTYTNIHITYTNMYTTYTNMNITYTNMYTNTGNEPSNPGHNIGSITVLGV